MRGSVQGPTNTHHRRSAYDSVLDADEQWATLIHSAHATFETSGSTVEAGMTVNPRSGLPAEWASDKQDLAELVKGVKPYTGGDEYAVPDLFASDEERHEFVAWVRTERDKEVV